MAGDSNGTLSERIHALEDRGGRVGANLGQMSNAVAARRARARRKPTGVVLPRRPVSSERRRELRKRRRDMELLSKCFETMLRTQPGVHTRNPSHIHPPFRAQPIILETRTLVNTANAPISLGFATFGGMNAVPDGFLGVVKSVCAVITYDATAPPPVAYQDPATLLNWTLLKNDVPVEGYRARFPNNVVNSLELAVTLGRHQYFWPGNFSDYLPAITLVPGDTLEMRAVDGPGADDVVAVRALVLGWIYPTRQDAPGILGTVVD